MVEETHEDADVGREIEPFREYLALLARLRLGGLLQGKIDLSGVVQQTLWEASRELERRSVPSEQRHAWLRQILANNLADEIRHARAAARDCAREQSIEQILQESSARLENWLAAEQSSPSERAIRNEQLLGLAEALAQLPEDQRMAVELHHLGGAPVAEVAATMQRSPGAVGQLLVRGLKRLRTLLKAGEHDE